MLHIFFLGFCNYYVSCFPRWFPNDPWFFNWLGFQGLPCSPQLFFSMGGGQFTELGAISPQPPLPSNFLQASDPHLTSDVLLGTLRTQHATSDIKHQTLYTILAHNAELIYTECTMGKAVPHSWGSKRCRPAP